MFLVVYTSLSFLFCTFIIGVSSQFVKYFLFISLLFLILFLFFFLELIIFCYM